MKSKFTFLMAAIVLLLNLFIPVGMWGQTRTATEVLTLDCATPAPTGSTSTALSSTSDVATFLNSAAGLSSAENKITCSAKSGDVYKGKGSGGGDIPQQCLKVGKSTGGGGFTFTIPNNYDNIDVVEITCYGWKTTSSISINSGAAQTFTTAQTETTKTFELASSTRTIKISVTSSAVCITEIVLKKNSSTGIATTTTITPSITNTNVYTGTAAGSLSAAVTYDNNGTPEAVPGATLSWKSSNEAVATVAADGTVTLVAAGNTNITASYEGNATYSASSDTYPLTVINENPALETIWSENFSSYSADDVPTEGTYSYVCTGSGTKIYDANLAGGTSPELLVAKSGGSFSATVPLSGCSGNLTLKFKANNTNVAVSTTTTGVTITGSVVAGTSTLTLSGVTASMENVVITFTNSQSSNVRIDDIVLKGLPPAVVAPTFDPAPASGAVFSGTEIAITCGTDGASIYYTTDESDPTASSTLYSSSNKPTITSATTTIKAIAIKGEDASSIATATYTIKHRVKFFNNTEDTGSAMEVVHGEAIGSTLPTTATAPNGYTFMGWATSTISGVQASAPTMVNAETIVNEDLNLQAVFAIGTVTTENQNLTYTLIPSDFNTGSYSSNDGDHTIKDVELTIKNVYQNSSSIQFAKESGGYLFNKNALGTKITSISIDIKTNSLDVYEGSTSNPSTKVTESSGTYTFSDNMQFFKVMTGTKYAQANSITVNYVTSVPTTTYSNYCTSVTILTLGDDITKPFAGACSIDQESGFIIESGQTLSVGALGNTDPANLIIEDGGQLICSSPVAMTVEKNIGTSAKGNKWYTISTPVHTGNNAYVTPENVTNLILMDGDDPEYDMFYYDEYNTTHSAPYWINHSSNLNIGQGYLYRNSNAKLSFQGTNNNADAYTYVLKCTSAAGPLAGFNLIGNPYPHNIYKNDVYASSGANLPAINDANLSEGYYKMNDEATWHPYIGYNNPIKPGEGILVKTLSATTLTISNNTNPAASYTPSKYGYDHIEFTVSNNRYEDVSYVMFNDGIGLDKISHRDENAPMIYIPQNGKDYAIATMKDNTETFGLNFKAMTTGKYTIRAKALGNFSYIHLIDRLTGEDVDLLMEDYSFIGSPADSDARFIVKLTYTPSYSTEGNDNFAYQTGSEILVSGEGELQIFDVTGRKVMTTTINGVEAISGLQQGVYVFRVIGETQKTQKIVVR